jgi:hypothetical protein
MFGSVSETRHHKLASTVFLPWLIRFRNEANTSCDDELIPFSGVSGNVISDYIEGDESYACDDLTGRINFIIWFSEVEIIQSSLDGPDRSSVLRGHD